MTQSPRPTPEPQPVPGPGPRQATRARRLALVGAAVLLAAGGGATAAFASDGSGTTYGTVVSTTEQPSPAAPDVAPVTQEGADGTDCPDKGGAGEGTEPGAGAESATPETSTL
jgi:hypothetical protein